MVGMDFAENVKKLKAALCPEEIKDQAILITGDIGEVLKELKS